MTASDLKQRVSVQNSTEASDGHDGFVVTWADTRARMAARVAPLDGKDLDRARQIDPRASHEVTFRFWNDYPAELDGGRARLIWHDGIIGDRTLEIVEPPREIEYRRALAMVCKELA